MAMIPRERAPYSAIVDRPPLKLPGGARVVVWTIVNLEVWDIARAMARQVLPAPTGAVLLPDVPNWSWHEYGMRVGFWRFEALFRRLRIRPTLALNARVCVDYPRVAQACKDAGWEFMGHSYEQGPIHREEDQPGMIRRSLDTIEKFTGKRPRGLARAGPHADARHARAPRRRGHEIHRRLGLRRRADRDPHRQRPARHPALFGRDQRHPDDAGAAPRGGLLDAGSASTRFERYYEEGAERAKIMAIAIHPYISGQPFRIKYLEDVYKKINRKKGVLHWNGEQILDWYLKARPQTA